MERVYLYQYCVVDEQGEVHHGLAAARRRMELMEDIAGNYGACRRTYVHQLPGMAPEIVDGQWTGRVVTDAAGEAHQQDQDEC